jgi:hypothetical protein
MPWSLLLIGALQAATLKVEAVEGSVLVYVDGSMMGRTPIVLELDDGRHPLEFKREEWQVASLRYGLLIDGQTKGKMLVDWDTEETKVVWAEDVIAAREAEKARQEAEARAEQERIEFERQMEEEARRAEQERQRAAEEQQRILEEEARREAAKQQYMPHREVGVAAMKEGDRRTALHAFRASREAGDDDKRIRALVTKLEGEMASLQVRVTGAKSGVPLAITVDTEEGEPFEPASESRGRYNFEDVPAAVPVTVTVSGPGYPSVVVPVAPLAAGSTGKATAQLEYFGNATLVLSDLPDSIRVTVTDPAGDHSPREAGELTVTAGVLKLSLDGPTGTRELELELADGATEALAVKAQMPGAVVLEGLPSGTELSLDAAPEGSTLSTRAAARDDVEQTQQGVDIAGPLRLDGLLPGEHQLALNHPVLGRATVGFAPVPGETDTISVMWETMSQAGQVKAARQDWEQRLAASKQLPKPTKLAFATGGGTVAVAAATALLAGSYLGSRSDLKRNEKSFDNALAEDDGQTAWDLYSSQVDLRRSARSSGVMSLGGLGITAAGAGITVVLFGKGRELRQPVEDWDLYTLPIAEVPALPVPELPVPTPADTPAGE